MCDFRSNTEPEMVKVRRVVVVSSGDARPVMLVVPLSTTRPWDYRPVHVRLSGRYVFLAPTVWAKCDLVTHVAQHRLDRISVGGRYLSSREARVRPNDLVAIRAGILYALGLGRLVSSL